MALSFHHCQVRTIRATIFQSRLPQRHAYNNYSRDLKTPSRVQYPQRFSHTPTHIKPEHSSGFLHSVLPKDRTERFGRWSAYTGIGMIGLLGAFWLWNQEKVPITGRKRFNFISHEYLENNEHKNFLKSLLLHYTMAITQHKPSVLLPADHPMNVVVQKVFYRLLKAQGQDSSGWKICVVRARGIDRVLGAANNQVLVYTGAPPVCQDEAGLASAIAHQIAACIMEPHSEVISHHYFVRLSAVPAIPLVIPAFLLPQTAVIAVPYLALWVAYAWTRDAACKTLVEQDRYAGTMVMARARYGIHAGIGYWVRYLERAERKIAEIGRLNSPIHREKTKEILEFVTWEKKAIGRLLDRIPNIMETFGHASEPQASKPLPLKSLSPKP